MSHRKVTERVLAQRSQCPLTRCSGFGPKRYPSCETEPLKGAGSSAKRGCQGKLPAHCSQHLLPSVSSHSRAAGGADPWNTSTASPGVCEPCSGLCKALASWLLCLGQWHSSLLPVIKISVSDTTFTASSLWASFLYAQFCFTTISTWPW